LDQLPPILIDQHNILIDGYHRWKAHDLMKQAEIKVEVRQVESEKELKRLAYQLNCTHGLQLSSDEKKKFANEMIDSISADEIAKILSVSVSIVIKWTKSKREALEDQRDQNILAEYLRAWNTQEQLAIKYNIDKTTISRIIKNLLQNKKITEMQQKFTPQLYNIWNTAKGNETTHFGSFPKIFMDNLLYYHTEPFDIVYDPFCGNGTTIDSCQEFNRRYYCADMQMKPGREADMKVRKIQDGYPDDLQKPDMVFLDPPYWLQAHGKYTDQPDDLSNVKLDDFYTALREFINELIKHKIQRIAIVISPTQYPNENHAFEDHIFEFHQMLAAKYKIEMRYVLPYSSQQYNGTVVDIMKEQRKCMNLVRDLVVWKLQ
jgi:DNA modification methylase